MEKGQKSAKAKVHWLQKVKDWFISKRLLSNVYVQVENLGKIKPAMGRREICKVGKEICRRVKMG